MKKVKYSEYDYDVAEISTNEAMKLMGTDFPGLTEDCFDEVERGTCAVAFDGEEPIGIIVVRSIGTSNEISYLFVKSQYRNKEIGKSLVTTVESYSPRACVTCGKEDYEDYQGFFAACDMKLIKDQELYDFSLSDRSINAIAEFISKRGRRISKRLARKGYAIMPFTEAGEGLLNVLYDDIGEGFDPDVNPFDIKDINSDYSYLAVKDGIPAAFLISTKSNSIVRLEQLSVKNDLQMKGISIALIVRFTNDIKMNYENGSKDVEMVRTIIDRDDDEMSSFIGDKFNEIITEKRFRRIYV